MQHVFDVPVAKVRQRQVMYALVALLSVAGTSKADMNPNIGSFKCRNNRTVAFELFCNGVDDCGDGSDEKTHSSMMHEFAVWQNCVSPHYPSNRSCLVQRQLICDGDITCSNLTPCDVKCDTYYRCQSSGLCVPRSTVCNGDACDGCTEDHGWRNGHGFKCRRKGVQCVLPQQLLHDDVSDCDAGVDICFSDVDKYSRNELLDKGRLLRDRCFQCLDDSMIISRSSVCDGIIDCPDLSDECLCGQRKQRPEICKHVVDFLTKTDVPISTKRGRRLRRLQASICPIGKVACRDGACVNRSSICDGTRDCDIDEKFRYCRGTINCREAMKHEKLCRCQTSELQCQNNYGIACDGKADCPSVHRDFNDDGMPEDECQAFCYSENWSFKCENDLKARSPLASAVIPCYPAPESDKADSTSEFSVSYDSSQKCDGKQNCIMGDDEQDCPDRFRCDVIHGNYVSILLNQTCDGVEDCRGGTDESEVRCNDTRFRCPALGGKMVNIARRYVCDFHINCDNEADEMNCPDGRFYCENGEPLYVKERKMFNGRGDCSDWSDECPYTTEDEPDAFASRYELIANPLLRALVWIMGLLSLCGNTTVLYLESKKLREDHKLTPIASANRLLILNLAASDIIMGVYLISLGAAGLAMRGSYCSQELYWRSSGTCVMLGVLSVLSSETSVITMIMLTSCRLYAVLKPFQSSSRPKKRTVTIMIASAWSISFILALIPLSPGSATTFVSHVQFKDDLFFAHPQTKITAARSLFKNLLTYDLKSDVTIPGDINIDDFSWDDIKSLSDKLFIHNHFEIDRLFGYYSINSVCIPKFFVTTADRSWGFSFFVTLFNFCSFLFVASAYTIIYFQSRKRANLRSSTRNNDRAVSDLQKKILRLIITDFFCWIPLCLIAFAKLAGAGITSNAYVFAAIVLLPINSALNPLLYSDLPDLLYRTIKAKLWRETSSGENESTKHNSSNNERGMTDSTFIVNDKKNRSKNSNKMTGKRNPAFQK